MRLLFLTYGLMSLALHLHAQPTAEIIAKAQDSVVRNPVYASKILNAIAFEQLADDSLKVAYLYALGCSEYYQSNYEEGETQFLHALKLAREDSMKASVNDLLYRLGRVQLAKTHHTEALKYFLKQLEWAKNHYHFAIPEAYNQLGVASYYLKNYRDAMNYFMLAKTTAVELNHPKLGIFMRSEALIYFEIDTKYADTSILLMKKALPEIPPTEHHAIATGYSLIGRYYQHLGQQDSSLHYLQKGLELGKSSGDMSTYSATLTQLSTYYVKEKAYDHALDILYEGLHISDSIRNYNIKMAVCRFIANTYKHLGNADSTLQYMYYAQAARDTLFNQNRAGEIADMEVKYETAEKERQLAATQLLVSEKENQLLMVVIIFLVVLFIVGITILRNRNNQRKKLHQMKVEEQERALKAVFNAQEEERRRIARELHDGVGQSMTAILMAQEKIEQENLPSKALLTMKKNHDLIESTRKEIREISHQMMPASLIEVGLSAAIRQMLENSLPLHNIKFQYDAMISENKRYPEHLEVGIYRIAQELVQNIIKHAQSKEVNINLYERNNHLHLIVEDDGVGFIESNTDGIGLVNLKARLDMIKGNVNIESEPGSGTLAVIKVPVS